MSLTEPQKPKKRRFIWLGLLVLVVFGAYSAGWFYLADRVRTEAAGAIAALDARGVNADCANLTVSGYPIRFAVSCDNTAYEDDARNVAASTGSISAVAPIYWPLAPVATVVGPLRASAPGMSPLWLDWDRLRAHTSLSWPMPRRVSLEADGLSGQTDPQDDTDPVQLFSAGMAELSLTPEGADVVATGSFGDLQIDAEAIEGRVLPMFDGRGDILLKDGLTLLAAPPASLRGRSLEIRSLELSSGTAGMSVSGPLSVDTDGLVDADLTIRLQNLDAVAAILGAAIPEQKRQIEQGFTALAMLGNKPKLPLKIRKGKASLGFIPLGRLKPLE